MVFLIFVGMTNIHTQTPTPATPICTFASRNLVVVVGSVRVFHSSARMHSLTSSSWRCKTVHVPVPASAVLRRARYPDRISASRLSVWRTQLRGKVYTPRDPRPLLSCIYYVGHSLMAVTTLLMMVVVASQPADKGTSDNSRKGRG